MRILLIGDIVGKPGRKTVQAVLPMLLEKYALDFVIANAENSAGGSGITPDIYHSLIDYGVDCVTLGDHALRKNEIFPVLDSEDRIVRPGNLPDEAPGKKLTILTAKNGVRVGVFSLLGRVFMKPVDCPFRAADMIIEEFRRRERSLNVIILDFHAEATSDKQLMGRYLDGRISAVLGTHTHVATADEQILPKGTAFQCDVGMCGPFESIIGRKIDRVLEAVRTSRPVSYDVASGDLRLCGTVVDVDETTGQATKIERVCIRAA